MARKPRRPPGSKPPLGSYAARSDPRPLTAPPPHDDDVRHDDQEYNPAIEPRKALAWLNLLEESETAFKDWNTHCDRIDERYASLARLANMARNKEFQLFWSNCEVLKPAIYATPPLPVVVTKFKDRRPVYQAASELLERCCTVAFDIGPPAPVVVLQELAFAFVELYPVVSRLAAWNAGLCVLQAVGGVHDAWRPRNGHRGYS